MRIATARSGLGTPCNKFIGKSPNSYHDVAMLAYLSYHCHLTICGNHWDSLTFPLFYIRVAHGLPDRLPHSDFRHQTQRGTSISRLSSLSPIRLFSRYSILISQIQTFSSSNIRSSAVIAVNATKRHWLLMHFKVRTLPT